MADPVNIANQALLHLGETVIQSFEEDSTQALTMNTFWLDSVKHALADIKPNFAIQRSPKLTPYDWPEGVEPDPQLPNAHYLPNDTVVVLGLGGDVGSFRRGSDWRIEKTLILTRLSEVSVRYVFYVDELVDIFDSPFVQCLSYLLAAKAAYALTESSTKMRDMFALYETVKLDNYHINGMESSTVLTTNRQLSEVR